MKSKIAPTDSTQTRPQRMNKTVFEEALFTMTGVTLRIRDIRILADTHWQVKMNENWALIGSNGAGKTTLLRAIMGQIPIVSGSMVRHRPRAMPEVIGYVSFENEQRFIDREREWDEARYFSGRENDLLTTKDMLINRAKSSDPLPNIFRTALGALDIEPLLKREVRQLSSGELRRVFIARALYQSKGLLILDEPFEGLDPAHRQSLKECLNQLMDHNIQVILATNRMDDIPKKIRHLMGLKNGRVAFHGFLNEMLNRQNFKHLYKVPTQITKRLLNQTNHQHNSEEVIIDVRRATVRYGDTTVFSNLSWQVKKGENWAISGPNGSGKTTLLQLITGDHLQAYANDIYLFGRRRGSGESIWDIKALFGVVSTELQRHYRKRIPVRDVVRSGFFDQIGLYRGCTLAQKNQADDWVKRLTIAKLMDRRFDQLSFGERKMVLIARAMVKNPAVLILDEPCQGLDQANRDRVLALADHIGANTDTQIIFVTQRTDEVPSCINRYYNIPEGKVTKTTIF